MPPPKPSLLGPLKPNRFRPPRGQKQIFLYIHPPLLPNQSLFYLTLTNHHHPFSLPYRPNFTLTLLRTPFSPPNCATFITPLNMNKLDLKDYLYNLYGVEVLSVRSYVQQARVRQDKPGARLPRPNRGGKPPMKKPPYPRGGGAPYIPHNNLILNHLNPRLDGTAPAPPNA
ncbi:MAG: hypothetical protein L6R40_001791 [Gallowayella cf. fulva]|nr:MAG: hypothetical protein L6R40_001791 [Xanthomendoza cf. fulva]